MVVIIFTRNLCCKKLSEIWFENIVQITVCISLCKNYRGFSLWAAREIEAFKDRPANECMRNFLSRTYDCYVFWSHNQYGAWQQSAVIEGSLFRFRIPSNYDWNHICITYDAHNFMIFAAGQMATPGKLMFPENHLYVRACAKNICMPNINGKNHIHEWHNTIILMSLKQVHLPLTHIWTHACMRAHCSPKKICNVHTWWQWLQNAWTKSKNTRRTRIIALIPIPIHIILCVQWFQIDVNVGDIFFIVIARSLFFVTFLHTL